MSWTTVETDKGARVRVWEDGDGDPVVFLHGAGGLIDDDPFLARLAASHRVLAPELPGYGESAGEDLLEDMLDFTLHGLDVLAAVGLVGLHTKPALVGHSMGGMIAAEMACLAPRDLSKLVLIDAAGLWIDEHPIPDLFAKLPFELPELLFHDPSKASLLVGGVDFTQEDALTEFMVGNARRLGMAGKILFPIPNRRLSKRLYRLRVPTLVLWGEEDKLIPPVYAERWRQLIPAAVVEMVPAAGHMSIYEQPDGIADAVVQFLTS